MMNTSTFKKLQDEQLVAQAQFGDPLAIGELYSRYYMIVFNKCLSFAKNTDDASDLAQDVMLRAIEKLSSFKGDAKFSTWLYSVTFNYCTDMMRKKKGQQFEDVSLHYELTDSSETELSNIISFEVKEEKASEALISMSEEDQQLLLMKYQMNKSIKEIQTIFGLSSSAVKMRLKRARQKASIAYSTRMLAVA